MKRKVRSKPEIRLMLDSGAFSAWTQGETISLKEYMSYLQTHKHLLDSYFNLDILPGQKGHKRTPTMIETGARESRKNYMIMRKAGLNPIPVFHQEEDFKWLTEMLADMADDENPYIALSTYKELSLTENREWLDRCFTILTDKGGWPIMKVHGLGVASFDLLRRYPWFSCDATSWALTAAYGSIFVPVYRNGIPCYSETPIKLTVSEQGKKDGSLAADHYLKMGPMMKERVINYLEKEVGVKVADAAKDYELRAEAIVHFFLKFQEAIGDQPFRFRRVSRLFA